MKEIITLEINPQDIAFLNKIFEAYDDLGLVSTIDPQKGIVKITATSSTYDDVMDILLNFPKSISFL